MTARGFALFKCISFQLEIQLPEAHAKPFKRLTGKRAHEVQCESVSVQATGGDVRLSISVSLPTGCDWTSGATSAWQVIPGTPPKSIH